MTKEPTRYEKAKAELEDARCEIECSMHQLYDTTALLVDMEEFGQALQEVEARFPGWIRRFDAACYREQLLKSMAVKEWLDGALPSGWSI